MRNRLRWAIAADSAEMANNVGREAFFLTAPKVRVPVLILGVQRSQVGRHFYLVRDVQPEGAPVTESYPVPMNRLAFD